MTAPRLLGNAVACAAVVLLAVLRAEAGRAALRLDFPPDPLARLGEAKRTELTCRRCSAPPKIDGALDDAAWRGAKPVTLERLSPRWPETRVRVCFDASALYLGVTCKTAPGVVAAGEMGPRDDPGIWKGDHVEIWLDPTLRASAIHQFVVGAGGAVYDVRNSDSAYDPAWRHAVRRGKGEWTFEAAIPKAALSLGRWQRRLGFNVGRNGPAFAPHAWRGAYGSVGEGALVLEGVTRESPRSPAEIWPEPASNRQATVGDGLAVRLDRAFARPGERFVEARIAVSPARGAPDRRRLRAAVFDVAGVRPLATVSAVPTRPEGKLRVDLRSLGLANARVAITLEEGGKSRASSSFFVAAKPCETPARVGERIAVKLDVPDGVSGDRTTPVTFGAPFAAGALWKAEEVRLVDSGGRELPHQTEVMARWAPEGSVKWLRFDALVVPANGCFVERARPTKAATPNPPLRVTERGDTFVIDTGAARYILGKGPSPIRAVRVGGRTVAASSGARGLYLIDQKGRLARASAADETAQVEARGPVAACVRFEGWYATARGERLARHITRVECFAGQPTASVTHTLVLTRDTNDVWFKEVGWELAVASGDSPRALFGDARGKWASVRAVPLRDDAQGAFMLQDRHFFFAHGENHFSIASLDAGGVAKRLFEGKECGDWAALRGAAGGLSVACKDAARQHPKEFEVGRDRITLRLFSNRAGEELDFRAPTLVKKWDLKTWYEKTHSKRFRKKGFLKHVASVSSNAIGWSKTHLLAFTPLTADSPPATAARAARHRAEPVHALVDPWALYRSKAMGPIYPSDPKRFPLLEKAVDAAFRHFVERDAWWGEHGFVDYFAGPHLVYQHYRKPYVGMKRYCYNTYFVRAGLWTVYARSGDRAVRDFAEGTNRTFMDGIFAHWDGKRTVTGLFRQYSGRHVCFGLPFYWGPLANLQVSSTSDHSNLMLDYYLTGYRRARDCMLEYAAGIKRAWTPERAARSGRAAMLMRLLMQTYAFTFDPVLKAMAEETFNRNHDPEAALALRKDFRRFQINTYKTNVDVRAYIEASDLFGAEKYRRVARTLAEYWWQVLGAEPILYGNSQGRTGEFLYRETGNAVYPSLLALQLRRAARSYDPKTNAIRPEVHLHAANVAFYFEGIPYALDVVTRAGADRKPLTSWVGYDDCGFDTSVIVKKGGEEAVNVQTQVQVGDNRHEPLGGIRVNPLPPTSLFGRHAMRVCERGVDAQFEHHGSASVAIPKDCPAGDYEILPFRRGVQFAIADAKRPMVFHAPKYWAPTLLQAPPARVFFGLPKNSRDARIFFEGSAVLFGPDGRPAFDGKPRRGWTDLPPDKPGVWAFEIREDGLVRVRNLPPFFAMGDKAHYFTPKGKPWSREAAPEPAPPPDMTFGPGAVSTAGNRSLYLAGRRTFALGAGGPHPSGDGGRFLPFRQGTVEFWMKPMWATPELLTPEVRRQLGRNTFLGKTLFLARMDSKESDARYELIHNLSLDGARKDLRGAVLTDGKSRRTNVYAFRWRTVFERGKWTHVAMVWGPATGPFFSKRKYFGIRVYVNGRAGNQRCVKRAGNDPALPMKTFTLGRAAAPHNIDAFVDELRISDTQRYTTSFRPPSRKVEFEADEHTRALFHFNGDLKGESHGTSARPSGALTK